MRDKMNILKEAQRLVNKGVISEKEQAEIIIAYLRKDKALLSKAQAIYLLKKQ